LCKWRWKDVRKEASEGGNAAYRLTWSTRLPPFSSQFPLVENVVGFLQLIIIIIILLLLDINLFNKKYNFNNFKNRQKRKKKKKKELGFVDSLPLFDGFD
jgi:hypothetical protein